MSMVSALSSILKLLSWRLFCPVFSRTAPWFHVYPPHSMVFVVPRKLSQRMRNGSSRRHFNRSLCCFISCLCRPDDRVFLLLRVSVILPPILAILTATLSFHFLLFPFHTHAIFVVLCCSGGRKPGIKLCASERRHAWAGRHDCPSRIFPRDSGKQTHCHARSHARVCLVHQVHAVIFKIFVTQS
jgi:hypothetical protein